jgi:hypothetical protein
VRVSVEGTADKFEIAGVRLKNTKARGYHRSSWLSIRWHPDHIRRRALKPMRIFECSIAQVDFSNWRLGPISVKSGAEIETGASFSLNFVPIL